MYICIFATSFLYKITYFPYRCFHPNTSYLHSHNGVHHILSYYYTRHLTNILRKQISLNETKRMYSQSGKSVLLIHKTVIIFISGKQFTRHLCSVLLLLRCFPLKVKFFPLFHFNPNLISFKRFITNEQRYTTVSLSYTCLLMIT